MKRGLINTALALLALVAVVLIAPGLINWSKHKDRIIGLVRDTTGYNLTIDGNVDFALLPSPHFLVEKLSASVPGRQAFMNVKHAELSIAVRPLFNGEVKVREIIMRRPEIMLEVATDGSKSWVVPQQSGGNEAQGTGGGSATSSGKLTSSIVLEKIVIESGKIVYADMATKKFYEFVTIDGTVQADSLRGPYTARGLFMYGGNEVNFNMHSGKVEPGGAPISLKGDIILPIQRAETSYEGTISFANGIALQGKMSGKAENFAAFLRAFGVKGDVRPFARQATVSGNLDSSKENFNLSGMRLTYADQVFEGSVSCTMPGGGVKGISAKLALESVGHINIFSMLPPKEDPAAAVRASAKPADPEETEKKAKTFIPESITLPEGLTANVEIKGSKLLFGEAAVDNYIATASWKENAATFDLSAWLPTKGDKGGEIIASGELSFASSSASEQDQTVTLIDPVLAYNFKVVSPDAATSILQFVSKDKEKYTRILEGDISLDSSGSVKPFVLTVDRLVLFVMRTQASASAAYKLGTRDAMAMVVNIGQINIDNWLTQLFPKKPDENLPMPSSKPVEQETDTSRLAKAVKKISLPFDLKMDVRLENVHLKKVDYSSMRFTSVMAGKGLEIRNFELKDLEGNAILLSAKIASLPELKDITIGLQGKTDDAKNFLSGFGIDTSKLPASIKSADVIASFKGEADRLDFTANLRTMGGRFDLSGALRNLLLKPVLGSLTMRVMHPNYTDLIRIFNPQFKAGISMKKDLDFYTVMAEENQVYNFSDIRAVIGGAQLSGKVSIDSSVKPLPMIKAEIQAGDLPLSQIMGSDTGVGASTAGRTAAAPIMGGRGRVGGGQNVKWPRDTIDVSWMKKFNMDLKLTAKTLTYGTWQFGKTALSALLKDGVMTVSSMESSLFGGAALLTGFVSAPAETTGQISLGGTASFKNVALESFVGAFSGASLLKAKGSVSFDADLKSAGTSMAGIVSGLHGTMHIAGSNVTFDGFDLARLSRTFALPSSSMKENVGSLLASAMAGGATTFDTLGADMPVTTGVIDIKPLKLSGKDAIITSTGNINLPFWTINLENEIKLAEPPGTPPVKVVFSGSLDNPVRTFGQKAVEGYMKQMIVPKIENSIMNKLQDKGILPAPLQKNQAITPGAAVADEGAAVPVAPGTNVPAAEGQAPSTPAPAPAVPAQQLMDMLDDVIQGR